MAFASQYGSLAPTVAVYTLPFEVPRSFCPQLLSLPRNHTPHHRRTYPPTRGTTALCACRQQRSLATLPQLGGLAPYRGRIRLLLFPHNGRCDDAAAASSASFRAASFFCRCSQPPLIPTELGLVTLFFFDALLDVSPPALRFFVMAEEDDWYGRMDDVSRFSNGAYLTHRYLLWEVELEYY